jgi:hypothetical protein
VDKSKEIKKQSFKIIFAVRRQETHDKDTSVSCVHAGRTAKIHLCRAFMWGARQRLMTVSVCPRRVTGGARALASLPCATVRRTAQAALCRAPWERCTAERSAPCVYRSRAAWRRRTAKSSLCRAPDRKRPANLLAHGKDRLSGSENY